jgi:hypothetical protein
MSTIPFKGDENENETALKFIMNVMNSEPAKLEPHMDNVTLTCLKILTQNEDTCDISDEFKVLTAKFIKNVVMTAGEAHVAKLQSFEAQMSVFEK